MIPFFEKGLRTSRLEMRHLEPTIENATMIFDAIKDESGTDYLYEPIGVSNVVPESVDETLEMMKFHDAIVRDNGVVFYMFYDNKFIGLRRFCYFKEGGTLKLSTVWIIKSARGMGFATESYKAIEKIAFEQLYVHRITRVNIAENKESAALARHTGFHLDGVSRHAAVLRDGKFYDLMLWSKLDTDER